MSALQQQTPDWLEFRKKKIGASDAPIIMGNSPWMTQYRLWQEKLSLVPPRKKTARMQRGLELEDEARLLFTAETGIQVSPQVLLSKEYDWMMASFDGTSQDGKTALEIKCPGEEDHQSALQGIVPSKYFPQLQHQMKVLDIENIYYLSYFPEHKDDFILFTLSRDEKYIDGMVDKEKEFWDCMKKEIPPQMSDRDYHEMKDDIWITAAQEWKRVGQSIKEMESKEKELREILISRSQGNSCSGGGVKVSKQFRKGSIDYSKVNEFWKIITC